MILIEDDALDIAKRLKEVDESYRLFYSPKSKRFELHTARDGSCLIVFPYESMDERMICHARRTRVERAEELIKELDEYNEKVHRDNTKEGARRFAEVASRIKGMTERE